MNCPEAVRKHDGRVVAYDSNKVAGSIARAASGRNPQLAPDAAKRLGHEIAEAVGSFLIGEGKSVPASAEIRTLTMNLLRETGHADMAGAYAEHARTAASLLWRIRVVEPGTAYTSNAGSPWDRRRLMDSLRASGIARDPAGDAAREVERRIVSLGQERISPALIHALGALVLSSRSVDTRPYSARRVAFSAAEHAPRFDAAAAQAPLPATGPALESFWLQAVHSPEVVRAVHDNLLSLLPYPSAPNEAGGEGGMLDPLQPDAHTRLSEKARPENEAPPVLCGDGPERINQIARHLALAAPRLAAGASICLLPGKLPKNRDARRAGTIAINVAGLMVREALRDPVRGTVRIANITALAVQAHREREEYFNLSPVRGRILPVAMAGVWNAAAWMQSENFDAPRLTRPARTLAATWVSVLRGAVDTLRNETSMELYASGSAPAEATRELWRRDREFLLRDGVTLDPLGCYDGGPSVALGANSADFSERLDFAKDVGGAFDDPPAVMAEVPLGAEHDAGAWRDFLSALAQTGVARVHLLPGGTQRGIRSLAHMIRSHLEGYPLFEQFMR